MSDVTYVDETIPLTSTSSLIVRQCASFHNAPIVDRTTDKTGLFVWRGAQFFVRVLGELHTALGPTGSLSQFCSGVLELGGGVGIGALATAAIFPRLDCLNTDFYPAALQLSRTLIALNGAAFQRNGSCVSVAQFDWKSIFVAPPTDSVDNAAHGSNESPWEVLTRSTLLDHACIVPAISQTETESVRAPRAMRWVLGLDVIYPDTRDDVLVALLATVHEVLVARRNFLPRVARCETSAWGGVFSEFVTSFCERDTGLTLRRIVLAASVVGLHAVPIVSPFASVGKRDEVVTPQRRVAQEILNSVSCTAASWERKQWSEFHRDVLLAVDCGGLGLNVCGAGVWMLCMALDPLGAAAPQTPNPAAANASLSTLISEPLEAVSRIQQSCNERWLRYLPWLWQVPRSSGGRPTDSTGFLSAYRAANAVGRTIGDVGQFPSAAGERAVDNSQGATEVWYDVLGLVEDDTTSSNSNLLDVLPGVEDDAE